MAGRLVLENVNKYFSAQNLAVSDFNLEVEEAEFLVLVGPSGCGKSTTLRMVAGLERVSSGEIFIDDLLVNDVPPRDRDIAMVFQNYALYPHMSVYDNMAFGLKMRRTPRSEIDGRVREVAKILNLNHLLKRKPRALSGGERQRVALGRAMVRHPRIFLMDEPLSNLDAQLRTQTRAEILKLHRKLQATFLYVTHDQVEAMTMGTRIAVMKEGKIQQIGSPQEVFERPANMFVAGFIGSPSMNFLPARLRNSTEKSVLSVLGSDLEISAEQVAPLKLKGNGEQTLILGVRPEYLYPVGEEGGIKCRVDVVEMMGAEMYMHMQVGKNELVARVKTDSSIRPGQKLAVQIDLSQIHLFDPQSGQSLM
ncbi:MAG: sn-glycerol-3-phosphate ABC transporter ATP-binding protein UgpC [Methanocorpusculum sp.]|nr:sn-glycerol-3-phosphate ABC transporter ATP-binding protein UgpC [Methanocorpusculum sp.]